MKFTRRVLALTLLVAPLTFAAQNATSAVTRPQSVDEVIKSELYVTPPSQLADAVLAPRYLNVSPSNFSADRTWFINEVGDGPVTMDVFSKPFHELGGLFIDYRANRNRTLTIRNNVALELRSATTTNRVNIAIPAGARVSNASWSPDGKQVAFFVHTPDATHVWVSDLAGKTRQLTTKPVLATLVTDFEWTKNGAEIVTVLPPDGRPAQPQPPAVPMGPRVKLAEESDKNMLRTYQSLMATPYDLDLLEWHATGQVAVIDVKTKAVRKVGAPRMVQDIDPSPDGRYIRITRMNRPFSYMVPVSNFGTTEEIVDVATGNVVAQVRDTPLNLGVDTSRAVTAPGAAGEAPASSGRREVTWRPDGQGLTYLEQEAAPANADSATGSDDTERPRRKDRVMQWLPPFGDGNTKVLYESNTRIGTHRYSEDMSVLFLSERTGPRTHEYAVFLNEPGKRYTIARYRTDDVNANPGSLVMVAGTLGARGGFGGFGRRGGDADKRVQRSADGESVYLAGTLYDKNPEEVGPRSFIDKVNVKSGQKSRVYLSDNTNVYERAVAFQDLDARRLLVTRESEKDVPQAFFRNGDQLTQITANKDYTPDLTAAKKENFIVERPDGFKFKVNVTMPTNYTPGTRVPAMFWFYPREYAGQEEYDRGARTFNKNEFPNFGARSMQFLTRMGYAVVEPDAPIVGKAGQQNNNYENDLRNNLAAVIDEVDRRGLVDRTRIGIGGHSYGAFSTVNAMSHTPFFKAGIAGDGNYNRTLTPLNFQSERRTLWDSPDTYLSMSPILHANDLTGALLMYHGMGDQNVGTELSNSPRLFHALNGLGKTTSMYLYPFEDHGPATKETMLDLWARWSAWLDKYVKNTPKPKTVS
jgi:dipeptidyl aminopeptidase/acylaminoacyl peptidase